MSLEFAPLWGGPAGGRRRQCGPVAAAKPGAGVGEPRRHTRQLGGRRAAPPRCLPPASSAETVVAVERLPGGGRRTYTAAGETGALRTTDAAATLSGMPAESARALLRRLLLPRGFPQSVTPDYLPYMFWSLPTHITGWVTNTLVTAGLLQAVGVTSGPESAAVFGAAAAIRWVTKDGLGDLGRLIVGGGALSAEFDEDPKRWRLLAEGVNLCGAALEILTSVSEASLFLPLAAMGSGMRAVSKGLGKPAFRVVQNHFVAANNIGEVAAKEEVWEVGAQAAGLLLGVALLRSPAGADVRALLAAWLLISVAHLVCRAQALSAVAFSAPNRKRAAILARAHVSGLPVPTVSEANRAEAGWGGLGLLTPPEWVSPRVRFGVALGGAVTPGLDSVSGLLDLHAAELHVLVPPPPRGFAPGPWTRVRDSFGPRPARVVLKAGAGPRAMLRACWQAAWLERAALPTSTPAERAAASAAGAAALAREGDEFEAAVAAAGWDVGGARFPLPGPVLESPAGQ